MFLKPPVPGKSIHSLGTVNWDSLSSIVSGFIYSTGHWKCHLSPSVFPSVTSWEGPLCLRGHSSPSQHWGIKRNPPSPTMRPSAKSSGATRSPDRNRWDTSRSSTNENIWSVTFPRWVSSTWLMGEAGKVVEMEAVAGQSWANASPQERHTPRWTTVLISSFKQQIAPSDVKYYLKKKK